MEHYFAARSDIPDIGQLETASHGGYEGLKKAVAGTHPPR